MNKDEDITTVVIIDDEEQYRNLVAMMLEQASYSVVQIEDGLKGWEWLRDNTPGLILCDINMPELDGYSLLKKLRENHLCDEVPFVFLTSRTEHDEIRFGMDSGADDYLPKPFSESELTNAVATQLAKKKHLQQFYDSMYTDIKYTIFQSLPHEFRTPLSGILGYSQLLMQEAEMSHGEVQAIGERIFKSAHRLLRILENVLLVNQLEYWRMSEEKRRELRKDAFSSILETTQTVVNQLSKQHNRPEATLTFTKDAIIRINPIHLKKLLLEIVDNAYKFSRPDTKVCITIEDVEDSVCISITDEGVGLSEWQIANIERLNQFDREQLEQQGVGLGLYIAKSLTEIYEGKFTITPGPKRGVTVSVMFPKAK